MRKIFTLVVLYFITVQAVTAQTVTRDEIRNFSEIAAYEAAHPESVKACPTCPKEKEADGGLNTFSQPPLPYPAGAIIKMSDPLPKRSETNNPVPMVPSRAPVQNYLGHVDVGTIIPPDTYGAVGLTQVVTATNNFIKIHAKVGGAQISQVTISGFTGVGSTCDPQMFFDPNTQRWIFVAIGCAGVNNPVILMTSLTSDATGAWRTITFVPLPGGLLDHPYLGYDDTKIVIGGRKFAGGSSFTGPDLYLINKSDMLSGVPIVFATNAQTIVMSAVEGDCPRPVTVYFPPFSNSGNPTPGTVYILQSWNNQSLRLTTVTGNIPSCVWNTGSPIFPTAPAAEAWTSGGMGNPGSVPQMPPEVRRLQANDARVSSAVMMNGKIWCVQHCAFPPGATAGSVDHTDVQYWQLDGTPGGTFGNVMQRGRTNAVSGQHRWFGSIALNKNEDVIVGYSISDATTIVPGAAYSTRQASTPVNTLDDPLTFHVGESRYWKDFGSGRARWGDYSQSQLDPVDNSLWTTQEYASTYVGFPGAFADNNSRFGTWWAQVPPSVPAVAPIITAGTATLVAEGCVPNNAVIDPGETVTVSFCALNTGTANTTNLVGTMQVSGGVTPISGPQNYGVLVFGGPAVCQNFTFSNTSGICGSTITVTIQWQDGATNLGTTSWTFTLGTTVVSSSENFDAVVAPALPAGWVATNVAGGAPLWVTSNAGTPAPPAVSLPNAIFIDDPGVITDKQIETPSFTPGGGARVSFQNNFNLESTFDGGVLEISINGGAYQDIITAGGSFVAGGYTGVISSAFGSPIAGRNAWTGSSGTFGTTTVNMPPASAGQPCKLKFRMGSDNSVAAVGWRVDDFVVSQPACCGAACTITCPANITVNSSAGVCGAVVNFPAPVTSGLCGVVTAVPASGSFFPVGTTTVTCTAAAGPSCTFTITVVDNVPPTITCPANITVNNTPGLCSAVVNYALPTVTDNCGLPGPITLTQTASQTPVAGSVACNAGGFHTLNSYWRAYNLAPLALPGPVTITSVQFGIELADANGTGTTQPVTVNVYTSAGAFPGGVRTLRATQVVNVPDQTLSLFNVVLTTPTVPLPANSILVLELQTPDGRAPANNRFFIGSNTSAQTGPSYISAADCGIATPTDLATIGFPNMHIILNAGGQITGPSPLTQIAGLPSGATYPVGVTTNTFRATDIAGNTSTCSFTVTVVDNQAPAVTCPANITQNTDPGVCIATVVTPNPTTSDNCGVTSVTWAMTGATVASSPAAGINYVGTRAFNLNGTTGQGVTTVTYTVKDAAGNTTICSFTVTVNDASIPVISGQPSNQFVCVGSDGAFTVTATAGAGNPLTYQWQAWNGSSWVNIAGATAATLPLPAVTFSMNTNSYRCILTGRCSVVTSGFATLYVNPLPTISLLASRPLALLPGQLLTITAVVNPGGGSYQWRKNGVVMAATGSSLNNLSVDDIGSYTCTYTDLNGCKATSAAMVVTGQASDKIWVYPNPNTGVFQVRFFNAVNEPVNVNIFNSAGQKVWSKALTTSGITYSRIDVDISNLAADTYTAQVVNSAGKVVGARKFVMVKL